MSLDSAIDSRRRVRIALLQLALAATAFVALPVAQASPIAADLRRLEFPELEWAETTHMMLSGIALEVRPFRSARSAAHVAEVLGARGDLFQRVLWRPQGMVMSGLADGWHWLAQISTAGPGSEGQVSAMRVPLHGQADAIQPAVRASEPPRWLPPGSTLRLQVGGMPPDGTTQEIYHIPLAGESLQTSLAQALYRDGWRPDGDMIAASSWRKGPARVQWFPLAADQGSHLYLRFGR